MHFSPKGKNGVQNAICAPGVKSKVKSEFGGHGKLRVGRDTPTTGKLEEWQTHLLKVWQTRAVANLRNLRLKKLGRTRWRGKLAEL